MGQKNVPEICSLIRLEKCIRKAPNLSRNMHWTGSETSLNMHQNFVQKCTRIALILLRISPNSFLKCFRKSSKCHHKWLRNSSEIWIKIGSRNWTRNVHLIASEIGLWLHQKLTFDGVRNLPWNGSETSISALRYHQKIAPEISNSSLKMVQKSTFNGFRNLPLDYIRNMHPNHQHYALNTVEFPADVLQKF